MNALVCPLCPGVKTLDDFYEDATRGTGRQAVCKTCSNRRREVRKRDAKKRRALAAIRQR